MLEVYRKLPYDFEDAFRALFQLLANGDIPLAFNYTAGKDGTAVAAGPLLTALGVPREVVLEDYQLSAQFFEGSCDLVKRQGGAPLFDSIDRALREPHMRVHPDYLTATFDRLQASHGSVDLYLRDQLGIDAERLKRLRSHLLE